MSEPKHTAELDKIMRQARYCAQFYTLNRVPPEEKLAFDDLESAIRALIESRDAAVERAKELERQLNEIVR